MSVCYTLVAVFGVITLVHPSAAPPGDIEAVNQYHAFKEQVFEAYVEGSIPRDRALEIVNREEQKYYFAIGVSEEDRDPWKLLNEIDDFYQETAQYKRAKKEAFQSFASGRLSRQQAIMQARKAQNKYYDFRTTTGYSIHIEESLDRQLDFFMKDSIVDHEAHARSIDQRKANLENYKRIYSQQKHYIFTGYSKGDITKGELLKRLKDAADVFTENTGIGKKEKVLEKQLQNFEKIYKCVEDWAYHKMTEYDPAQPETEVARDIYLEFENNYQEYFNLIDAGALKSENGVKQFVEDELNRKFIDRADEMQQRIKFLNDCIDGWKNSVIHGEHADKFGPFVDEAATLAFPHIKNALRPDLTAEEVEQLVWDECAYDLEALLRPVPVDLPTNGRYLMTIAEEWIQENIMFSGGEEYFMRAAQEKINLDEMNEQINLEAILEESMVEPLKRDMTEYLSRLKADYFDQPFQHASPAAAVDPQDISSPILVGANTDRGAERDGYANQHRSPQRVSFADPIVQ